jgi:hypothetical protein
MSHIVAVSMLAPVQTKNGTGINSVTNSAAIVWHLHDLADPIEALALERLLNQGINSGNVADQFL